MAILGNSQLKWLTELGHNSVTVFCHQVRRPAWVTGQEWENFWRGYQGHFFTFDPWTALVYGVLITRPTSVTIEEWMSFWQARLTTKKYST